MTFQEKESYLVKAKYDINDVRALLSCCKKKAWETMNLCREFYKGTIKSDAHSITAESFWQSQGTTLMNEIMKARAYLNGN